MSVLAKRRIVDMPDDENDYADMVERASIFFKKGRGEFTFGCVAGAFTARAGRRGDYTAIAPDW